MQDYTVKKVRLDFSNQEWEAFFLFRKKCAEMTNKTFSHKDVNTFKEIMSKHMKNNTTYFMLWDKGEEAGVFFFETIFPYDDEKKFSYMGNHLNDKKIKPALLPFIFNGFIEHDPTVKRMAVKSENGQNDFFEELFEVEIGGISESFELYIKDAKTDIINHWYENSQEKFKHLRMEFYDELPDELIQEYADVFTELLFDMPPNSELGDYHITAKQIKENQEIGKKANQCSYRYLIFNEEDKLIAKTNIFINKNDPKAVYQYMTGVLRDYRRQGLSKWLKSAMFKKITSDFPELEKIDTTTHPENHASREMSRHMGFQKTGAQKEYLIPKNQILHFLEKS